MNHKKTNPRKLGPVRILVARFLGKKNEGEELFNSGCETKRKRNKEGEDIRGSIV